VTAQDQQVTTGRKSPGPRGLATLALLKTRFDAGYDHLGLLEPFVVDVIPLLGNESFTTAECQAALECEHGLRVPQDALITMLARVVRTGAIRRDAGRYWPSQPGLQRTTSLRVQREASELAFAKIGERFVAFASEKGVVLGTPLDGLALLIGFIAENEVVFLLDEVDGRTQFSHRVGSGVNTRLSAAFLLDVGLPSDAADALLRLRQYCGTKADELEVLSRALPAMQLAHRWAELIETAKEVRALEPVPNLHDRVELMSLYALSRSTSSPEPILADLVTCVRCEEANPRHRVQAANLAMKIASDIRSYEIMDEVHMIAVALGSSTHVDEMVLHELEMVFHTSRGDPEKATESIQRLIASARNSQDPFVVATYFGNCATALCLLGRTDEAGELIAEGIHSTLSHRCHLQARHLVIQAVRIELDSGNAVKARAHFDLMAKWEFPVEDKVSNFQLAYLHARLLLEEDRVQEAENALEPALLGTESSVRFRGPILATAVRIANASGKNAAPLVDELQRIHLAERANGWHDFEAHELFVGLSRIGKRARAADLLREYLTRFRRDLSPVPVALTALLED